MQVGQPSKDRAREDDHDGKPGSSKLAMGLKIAAELAVAGTELAVAGAELVETLGQLM